MFIGECLLKRLLLFILVSFIVAVMGSAILAMNSDGAFVPTLFFIWLVTFVFSGSILLLVGLIRIFLKKKKEFR